LTIQLDAPLRHPSQREEGVPSDVVMAVPGQPRAEAFDPTAFAGGGLKDRAREGLGIIFPLDRLSLGSREGSRPPAVLGEGVSRGPAVGTDGMEDRAGPRVHE